MNHDAIEALSKPNYETDTEVRLAVTNRKKEKVILWDAFGELEYYPIEALKAEETIEIKPTKVKGDFRIDDIDKNRRSIFEDIVWIVRCRDCRHLYNKDFCSFFGSPTDAMDYCSHGERREE